MSNPYTDRMGEIARLRNYWRGIEHQIGDEIAKAWRLAPVSNIEVFSANLGMDVESVVEILGKRGIVVRIPDPIAPPE